MRSIPPQEILEKEYGYTPEHNEYRITPEEARKLAQMFNTTEKYWLNIQEKYDIKSNPSILRDEPYKQYEPDLENKSMTDIWILLCIQILLLIWSVSIISELISQEI
jgi:hypothetical protein